MLWCVELTYHFDSEVHITRVFQQRAETEQDRALYIFRQFIPDLLNSILNRRFDLGNDDFANLLKLLRAIAKYLPTKVGNDEVIYLVFIYLFIFKCV